MPNTDKGAASRRRPVVEDDALIYRVPDEPPADGTVTVDHKDGTFTYAPAREGEGSAGAQEARARRPSRTLPPG